MAVKKIGYTNEKNGVYLPEAYGILDEIKKSKGTNFVTATFVIKASREHTGYVDTVKVSFTWDRKTNLAEMAYNEAKSSKIVKEWDEQQGEIDTVVYMPFYGWQDDYS